MCPPSIIMPTKFHTAKNKIRTGFSLSTKPLFKKKSVRQLLILIFLFLIGLPTVYAEEIAEGVKLLQADIHPNDILSLQRGAKLYINYCSGCHALSFMRYNRMAQDIGIVDKNGQIYQQLLKNNLIFTGARISDTLQIAMQKEDARSWFGVAPPDLSVIARARGVDWLYTYLMDFYQDNTRPFGVNNLLFNETAMPDVLVGLRGIQVPVYRIKTITLNGQPQTVRTIDNLVLVESGSMSTQQFNAAVRDLVNFLAYVGEPTKQQRQQLGIWVLGFLIIFAVLTYFLKREYWKNVD